MVDALVLSEITLTDNLDKRERDLGVPLLRRLEDEVVERLTDLVVLAVVRICGEL